MQKTTIGIIVAALGIALVAGIIYLAKREQSVVVETPREEAQQADETPLRTVNVKHQYKDDTHTFVGMIETPTPCYDVDAVILPGETPEIRITTKPTNAEMCAQVITEQTFRVSQQGPENMQFLATVNGEPVNLNQFDIDADVDIDTVEVFIKG